MSSSLHPHVTSETGHLRHVVLGRPESQGPTPTLEHTYDARSYLSVQRNEYPTEAAITDEMAGLEEVLLRYGVKVHRPEPLEGCNQIFARDVSFVIEDTLFVSRMIADRAAEVAAFGSIHAQCIASSVLQLPEEVQVEGGDVVLYGDILLVGTCPRGTFEHFKTARTNQRAIDFLTEYFPHKRIVALPLHKDDRNPYRGVLHLDCAFQPVGDGYGVIYEEGFVTPDGVGVLEDIFGRDRLFRVTAEEAVSLHTNFLSLSPEVVCVEAGAMRLAEHLKERWGIQVERVPYSETSKQGGLLRCSTCPLVRD